MKDVQKDMPEIVSAISKVGVRNVPVLLPIVWEGVRIKVSSKASIYTDLEDSVRGTHMSRLVQTCIKASQCGNLSDFSVVYDVLKTLSDVLHSKNAYIKYRFSVLQEVEAPMSKNRGVVELICELEGELVDGEVSFFLQVEIPYTSLCPCSKAISANAAHNQRSVATIRLKFSYIRLSFDRIIKKLTNIVDKSASCSVYPILKREDEKYVVDHAYNNPAFVEDVIRSIAYLLNIEKIADAYTVVVNHFESIHQHDAVAILRNGLE